MVAKLGNMDDPLPQESFEGVDDDEWVSDCNGNGWEDETQIMAIALTYHTRNVNDE